MSPTWSTGIETPTQLPVESFWADVMRIYGMGTHPAMALCLRHRGEVVLDRVVGCIDPTQPAEGDNRATTDTLFNLFSASKMVTATVIHALVERGVLSLDERVGDTLPEWAAGDKAELRLLHLLNHTAGMADMPPGLNPSEALHDVPGVVKLLARRPLTARPGETVAYHAMTSWAVLMELVRHRTGENLRTLTERLVTGPLGLDLNFGVSADRMHRVAKHQIAGLQGVPIMESRFQANIGVSSAEAVRLSNRPDFLQAVLPSANAIATPRTASAFLQMLLNGGTFGDTRVLKAATVHRMTQQETPRAFDGTFGFPMRYGLGVMKGGRRFSLFGPLTRRAYGHLGFSNVLAYADPERQLVMVFLNTGKPLLALGMIPWAVLVQRIALQVPRTG